MDNFLSAQDLIINRLKSQIDPTLIASTAIHSATSELWVTKNALPNSLSVIFYDDTPLVQEGGQRLRSKNQISEQFWLIVLTVRNVSDAGVSARQDLGRVVLSVLQALQGWQPSIEHSELHRVPSPYRITDGGNSYVYMSFLFSTKIITKGIGNA